MTDTPATTTELLRFIADGVAAGLPCPVDLTLQVSGPDVDLQIADNDGGGVGLWAERFVLSSPRLESHVFAAGRKGRAPWRQVRVIGHWRGWRVEVWSAIDVKPES